MLLDKEKMLWDRENMLWGKTNMLQNKEMLQDNKEMMLRQNGRMLRDKERILGGFFLICVAKIQSTSSYYCLLEICILSLCDKMFRKFLNKSVKYILVNIL